MLGKVVVTAALLAASIHVRAQTCQSPGFGPPTAVGVPDVSDMAGVLIGDWNRDGLGDLAVAKFGSPSDGVFTFARSGSGFGPPTFYPVGPLPVTIRSADFNSDGHPDLVMRTFANNVAVLLAQPNGVFAPATYFPSDIFPSGVAVGDFNEDHVPDLAVSHVFSTNVAILIGDGTGAFAVPRRIAVGFLQGSIFAGDVDGDGHLDVVSSRQTPNNVFVLLGYGTGAFTVRESPMPGPPSIFAAADFNGDGRTDLVMRTGFAGALSIMTAIGGGNFAPPAPIAIAGAIDDVATADFDGDGFTDLVVSQSAAGTASLLLGRGDATFAAPRTFDAGPGPGLLATGDVNGDGRPDVAIASVREPQVSIVVNSCPPPPAVPALSRSSILILALALAVIAHRAG
jgi:hypothetical protein